jgi:hypothetical protein
LGGLRFRPQIISLVYYNDVQWVCRSPTIATYLLQYLQTFKWYCLPFIVPIDLQWMLPIVYNACKPSIIATYHLKQLSIFFKLQILGLPPYYCHIMVLTILWQKLISILKIKTKSGYHITFIEEMENYYIKHNKTLYILLCTNLPHYLTYFKWNKTLTKQYDTPSTILHCKNKSTTCFNTLFFSASMLHTPHFPKEESHKPLQTRIMILLPSLPLILLIPFLPKPHKAHVTPMKVIRSLL